MFQAIVGAPPIANRDCRVKIAARRLQAQGFHRTLAQNRELQLAECALHAEQQAVVNQPRIIDPVLVDDQAVHKGAEFQKRMPVTAVTCQPGGFDRQHRCGGLRADRREQTLKPGSGLTAARSAEVIVDDDHVLPAERPRPLRQVILATAALRVVQQLVCCRLSNIHVSAACQMVGCDPIHRPPRPAAPRWRLRIPPSAASAGA